MSNTILDNRTKSGFPLSIGTGLAFETIHEPVIDVYDQSREVPQKITINNYETFAINIETLYRNILSSIPSSSVMEIKAKDYHDTLLEEISYIYDLFSLEDIEIEVYYNSYNQVKKQYGAEKFRIPNTPRQIYIHDVYETIVDKIKREYTLTIFNYKTKFNSSSVIIFTHIPYDLVDYKNYDEFVLLESHTGVIKNDKKFSTKYYPIPNEDMSILPFREDLLMSFGDHVMIKPIDIIKRRELYNSLVSKKDTNYKKR